MARPEKVAEVQAITERLQSAQSLVLADFTGLTVHQMTDFRAQCREKNIDCRVVKNRLAMIAADSPDSVSFFRPDVPPELEKPRRELGVDDRVERLGPSLAPL